GFLKCTTIGNKITYNIVFKLPHVLECVSLPINLTALSFLFNKKTLTSSTSVYGAQL
ncbi:hypothetical protein K469DRAFT_570304, partial [Zopfia rhizophila CBS 207.26]